MLGHIRRNDRIKLISIYLSQHEEHVQIPHTSYGLPSKVRFTRKIIAIDIRFVFVFLLK